MGFDVGRKSDYEPIEAARGAEPNVCVCCAVLNEGPDLETTIASLCGATVFPDSFTFVDDSSREPIHKRVESAFGGLAESVKIIRNERRRGVGFSRTLAHRLSRADVYIFIDSHMRFPSNWLEELLKHHAGYPGAIIGCASVEFDSENALGCGCHFEPAKGFVAGVWNERPPDGGSCPLVECIMGACYLVPKKTLDHIGGWAPCLLGYGFDEEYLCLRAMATGVEVRVASNVEIQHRYHTDSSIDRRPAEGTAEEGWEALYNRSVTAAVCLPNLFEARLRSSIRRAAPISDAAVLDRKFREHAQEIDAVQRLIQANRVVLEEALARRIGLSGGYGPSPVPSG